LANNIIATNTFKGETSEFSAVRFTGSGTDVKLQMVCEGILGSIKGLEFINAINYGWYTENNVLVSKTIDLIDVGAGKYKFIIDNGYCFQSSAIYEIKDVTIQTDLSNIQVIHATCGKNDGSIKGIKTTGTVYEWRDGKNDLRSDSRDLINVEAGVYTLTVANDNC